MNFRRLLLVSLLSLASVAPDAVGADAVGVVTTAAATECVVGKSSATIDEFASYAARELAAADLETFAGGHDALYVLAVVVLVVLLVVILI